MARYQARTPMADIGKGRYFTLHKDTSMTSMKKNDLNPDRKSAGKEAGKEDMIREYEALTYEAVSDYNRSDFKQALEKFELMARANPDNPKIHEILVRLHIKNDDLPAAREALEAWKALMIRHFPDTQPYPERTLEELAEEAASDPELENRCCKILSSPDVSDPFEDLDSISKLGLLLMARGEYEEAERVLSAYREKIS